MAVGSEIEAAAVARQLEAKAADCFRLAELEQIPRVKENYRSLAYHFKRVARDLARRSQGDEPQPFVSSLKASA